jgi:modulator of FtsH protease
VPAYAADAWETFFAANAGAAAALAGLVFVGVSINVDMIAPSQRLAGRALEAFALLASVLIISVLGLVPEITRTGLGIALLVTGSALWLLVLRLDRQTVTATAEMPAGVVPRGSIAAELIIAQLATLPVVVAAVTLLLDAGGGLYWLVPSTVFAYVGALMNAWVLLIEVRR